MKLQGKLNSLSGDAIVLRTKEQYFHLVGKLDGMRPYVDDDKTVVEVDGDVVPGDWYVQRFDVTNWRIV